MRSETGPISNGKGATARHGLWTAGVFLGALALYIKTAAPDFVFDDNSEFITSSYYLGVTHPPGYPVFSLLGKLFSYLAPGTAGFTVNLVSVFAGAAAVALAYRLFLRATGRGVSALLGAAVLAVSRLFWEQASQADVYALNAFFLLLTLNIIWGLECRRSDAARLVALAAVAVFALINHYTMTLVLPIYVIYLFWLYRGQMSFFTRLILPAALVVAIGCSVTMYLPFRSAVKPVARWDEQTDLNSFIKHVRGVDLRSKTPRVPMTEKWRFVKDFANREWRERSPFLLLFLPIGLWAVFSRGGASPRHKRALLFIVWFSLFAGFIMLPNYLYGPRASYVVKSFFVTPLAMLALIIGFGADTLMEAARRQRLPWGSIAAVSAVLLAYSALVNRATTDNSNNLLAPRYGRNMLVNMARDGVLFSTLETESFPVANLRAVHYLRRDITLHGRQGDEMEEALSVGRLEPTDIQITKVSDLEEYALRHTVMQRQIYFTKRLDVANRPNLAVVSDGLLYHLSTEGKRMNAPDPWRRIDTTGINYDFKEYDHIQKGVLARYLVMHGEHYLELAQWNRAIEYFDRAEKFHTGSRFLHANLGAIYLRVGDYHRARREFETGLAVDPENVETSIDTVAMYSNLSFIYGSFGENEKALESMETAARLAPDNSLIHVNLGKTYWHNNRFADAVDELETAIRLGVKNASVYDILGICYERLGLPTKARKYYELALQSNPALPDVYRDYGIFNAYVANQPARAVELLNMYLELSPGVQDEPEIRVNIGFLNQMIDRHEAAAAAFRMALLLGADNTPRKAAVINCALAKSLDKTGHADQAAEAFEKALANAPEYPEVYVDYAEFLEKNKKNAARAVQLLEKYLAAVPNPKDRLRVDLLMEKLKAKTK